MTSEEVFGLGYAQIHRAIFLTYDEEYRKSSGTPELSSTTITNALWFRGGFRSLEEVERVTDEDLLLIKGIGPGRLERIRKACAELEESDVQD
jgi:DNA integrity scanning protein DisA with diadenylate cyclase activity